MKIKWVNWYIYSCFSLLLLVLILMLLTLVLFISVLDGNLLEYLSLKIFLLIINLYLLASNSIPLSTQFSLFLL